MPYQYLQRGTRLIALCASALLLAQTATSQAARPSSAPVIESSVQASPTAPTGTEPVVGASAQASPVPGSAHALHLPPNTILPVRLLVSVDSAHLRNGDTVSAVLVSSVRTHAGQNLAAGTRIALTVISVSPAGKLASAGEFTLEVVRVGSVDVLSDEQTFYGKEGHKDLPDSNPAKGTEASLAAGTVLRFHLPPPPR